MSKLLPLDDASFADRVLGAPAAVVVLFSAAWCPPCRRFAPVIERVAAELERAPTLAKVDVDTSPALAERYGVRALPTLVVLRAGEVAARHTGTMSPSNLRQFLGDAAGLMA